MYITVHAAAGAAIGQFVDEPWIAFLLGFVSHFVLDAIPHGDEGIVKWKLFKTTRRRIMAAAILDFASLMAVSVLWIVYSDLPQLTGIFYGIAGAILPDALWGFHELTGAPFLNWYRNLHASTHKIFKIRLNLKQGFMLQIPVLVILTLIILIF